MLIFHETQDTKAIRGCILNPVSDTNCQTFDDGIIVAKFDQGEWLIEALGEAGSIATDYGWALQSIPFNEGLILPPFYDTHFHWVQDDVRDMPKVSLLDWLERYTFPEEARFADPDYAEVKARQFWGKIHSLGTVGGLCYSSIHATALDAAMKYAPPHFRIGGSLMTMNCPGFIRQTIEEAIEAVSYGVQAYGDRYCITPRFAPTTHAEVMKAAAKLANNANLFQQTHLDETLAEIEWVLGIYRELDEFADVETYTEIYQRCGMLGPRTVMGHAIHLEPSELSLLAETNTAIASCPTSNAPVEALGLGSGLFNFEQAEKYGIRWSLASDIGGGPFLSMFDVIASFVQQNRDAGVAAATYVKGLYRSTLAGADVLGYSDSRGNFAPGKSLDLIHCPLPLSYRKPSDPEEILSLLINQANYRHDFDTFVLDTIVNGSNVFERTPLRS